MNNKFGRVIIGGAGGLLLLLLRPSAKNADSLIKEYQNANPPVTASVGRTTPNLIEKEY